MGKFNIQRARGSLPGRSTQVRADLDVRTGGQQIAQAVSALGGAIFGLGEKYYNIQAATQLSQAERIATERMNALSLSFEGNLDPESYQKEYDKALEDITKSTSSVLTNKMAAANFQMFRNDREPRWQDGVTKSTKARVKDNWLAELYERQAGIEQSGLYGDFSKYVAQGVGEGMIDRSDGVRVITQTKKLAASGAELNLIDSYWQKASPMPIKESLQFLNNAPNLTSAQRNDLIARRKRQEEIATATTDPEVYWPLLRRVTADPKGITEQEIGDTVGKGITTDDYKELVKIQESKVDPLKTPRAQIYLKHLDDLYKNKNIETVSDYDSKMEQLIQFFKANPNATSKQTAEFYDNMLHPIALSWFERLGKALRPKESTPFWRHFGTTEEAALAKKKAKTGTVKDVSEMTDEELDAELMRLK